ncbi:acetyl esterase [Eggerthellaceae bacterium zg-997]|nr:acetyl esterase [Eggerthellaceae bacterium zg-997]
MNKIDVLAAISPQMRAVLAREDELAASANETTDDFRLMRENYERSRAPWVEGGPVMADVLDIEVPGPAGTVPVRLYYPTEEAAAARAAGTASTPAIVYAHGGGFVLGGIGTHDRICRLLAARSGVAVASVDYRLSPEARFPSAVREVAAVASFLNRMGAAFGVDGQRLAFAGDSGGAHLSLAATLYLRDQAGSSAFVRCLLLYYGWFGLFDSASMRLLGGPWDGLSEDDWAYYLRMYANDPAELRTSPYANLLAADLSHGVPPCYIAAAELDPLRDDSAALATMLANCGVERRHVVFEGVLHAFLHYTKMLDAANEAIEQGAEFARRQLAC